MENPPFFYFVMIYFLDKNSKINVNIRKDNCVMFVIEIFVQSSSSGKDGVGEWVERKLPQLFTPDIVKEIDGNLFKTISALKELAMTTHRNYFFRFQNEDNGYEYYHYPINGGSSNLGCPYFMCITEKVYDIHPSTYLELTDLPDDITHYYKSEAFEEELYDSMMINSVEDVEVIAFLGKLYTKRDGIFGIETLYL